MSSQSTRDRIRDLVSSLYLVNKKHCTLVDIIEKLDTTEVWNDKDKAVADLICSKKFETRKTRPNPGEGIYYLFEKDITLLLSNIELI